MTDGPSTRAEALALVATIVVRVARRMAEHDAAQVSTRQDRIRRSGPATIDDDRPLAKENARAQHDTSPVRQGGGHRGS